MIIQLIVAREKQCSTGNEQVCWVESAWDEYTLDENPQGYMEAIDKACDLHGGENVRIINVKVPDNTFHRAFAEVTVDGTVEKIEKPE